MRNADGVIPVAERKARVKALWSLKPQARAISATDGASTARIFHEKGDVRGTIEEPFEQADFHLRNSREAGGAGGLCARIHSSMRF